MPASCVELGCRWSTSYFGHLAAATTLFTLVIKSCMGGPQNNQMEDAKTDRGGKSPSEDCVLYKQPGRGRVSLTASVI